MAACLEVVESEGLEQRGSILFKCSTRLCKFASSIEIVSVNEVLRASSMRCWGKTTLTLVWKRKGDWPEGYAFNNPS